MKAIWHFSILCNFIFNCHPTFSQTQNLTSSNTKAFQCALYYIESFNKKNTEHLEKYFTSYYQNLDLERRIGIESSLQKSRGKNDDMYK
jgi:hypothetical protein